MEKQHADLLRLTGIDRDTDTIRFLYRERRSDLPRDQIQRELERLRKRGWVSLTPEDRWLITEAGAEALAEAEDWEFRVHTVRRVNDQLNGYQVVGEVVRGSVHVVDDFTIRRGDRMIGGGSIRAIAADPEGELGLITLTVEAKVLALGDVLNGQRFTFDERKVPETLSPLEYLVAWYAEHCNGDWEHAFGIELVTIDNPGWHLKVDLVETGLEGRVIPPEEITRSDHDWITVKSDGSVFVAFGGSSNLQELLERFRSFSVEQGRFLDS